MRSIAAFGVGVAAALALGVVCVGSASAAKPKLAVTEEEALYSGSSVTAIELHPVVLGWPVCRQIYSGQITSNRPTVVDEIGAKEPYRQACYNENFSVNEEYSITGGFRKLKLSWDGWATTVGNVRILYPGPCVYDFSGGVAMLKAPRVRVEGTISGWLVSKESNLYCTPTKAVDWEAYVFQEEIEPEAYHGILDWELRG